MSAKTWRNVSLVLVLLCIALWWRGRGSSATRAEDAAAAGKPGRAKPCAPPDDAPRRRAASGDRGAAAGDEADEDDLSPDDAADRGAAAIAGISVPSWVRWFAPHPGEDLLDYRDRVLPFAQTAVAPHRARVQRGLADFAAVAQLDERQRAELEAVVDDAGAAIQDRIMQGVLSGDLMPAHFKPSTGVAFARDLLDTVDAADRRFAATLRDDQRAALADHPFDVADYLLFSVPWEDMLGVTR